MSDTKISFVQSKAFFYSAVVHIAILFMVILSIFLKVDTPDEKTDATVDILASLPEEPQEKPDASRPAASKPQTPAKERKAASPSSPARSEQIQTPVKTGFATTNKTRDPLEERAQNGNAEAQYQMAIRYKDGTDIPTNDENAAKWFLAAAAQGHADAQYWAAIFSYHGRGTAVDRPRARQLLENAAAQGHSRAQIILTTPASIQNPRNPSVSAPQKMVYASANAPVRGYPYGRTAQQRAMQQRAMQQRAMQQRAMQQRALQQRAMQQRAIQQRANPPTHLYYVSNRSVRSALRESHRTGTPLVIHDSNRLSNPLHITPEQAGSSTFRDWLLCDVLKLD